MRKGIILFIFAIFLSLTLVPSGYSFTLLTREQALADVFPSGVEYETETKVIEGELLERVKERLGGDLVFRQEGSESAPVGEEHEVEFIFAKKGGERIGVAIIEVQPGKWGPVEFIVAMDLKPMVRQVRVMSYQEKRGRPIARMSFMQQYRGKTTGDTLEVGKDIYGISGATISSRAATFTVKKALVLYEEVYQNQ